MSEYWVSKDKYFCKYCNIYIADDKPSRNLHETGLRHKGNLERYIRDIYKKGENSNREAAEEAREISRMNEAAHRAMAIPMPTASTSKLPPPPKTAAEKKKARSTDPYADYSTAESLGFVDEEAAKLQAQAVLRKQEGSIGQWEKVGSRAASGNFSGGAVPKGRGKERTAEEVQEDEEKEEEAKRLKEEEREWRIKEEEKFNRLHDRDNHRDYLHVKTATLTDEAYDPSKVAIKLKRSRMTIKEEQDAAVVVKQEAEELAAAEREKARIKLEERGAGGWNEVAVTNDAMVFADTKEEEQQEEVKKAVVEDAVVKEEVAEEVPAEIKSVFKKRKVNASQRKR